MKIGFIYYTFYPVTGGASVHGYNLAKELYKKGYELFKINGDPDPYTHRLKNPVTGLFWILVNCDVIYIRMDYFLNLRNFLSVLTLFSGKKMIIELNNPSDELHLFGRGERYIRFVDRVVSKILKRADAVITVSEPLKRFCEEALQLENVHVIENGGEIFIESREDVSTGIKQKMEEIKQSYQKTIVWSGSANNMQDLKKLEKIAESQRDRSAVICIIKVDEEKGKVPSSAENLFVFKNLPRSDVKHIISNSDIGLALYREYPWSRWGFYNSSLKIFEYLNNGLLTITNTEGTEIQQSYPNFKSADSVEEIVKLIEQSDQYLFEVDNLRTWSEVAEETSQIIQQVVNR
jgi:hypothetical protein